MAVGGRKVHRRLYYFQFVEWTQDRIDHIRFFSLAQSARPDPHLVQRLRTPCMRGHHILIFREGCKNVYCINTSLFKRTD